MTGLTDYTAFAELNFLAGRAPQPALPEVWMALFTVVGTDAGTGFTEPTGDAYARTQVAGQLSAGAAFTTGDNEITLDTTAPAWLLALGTTGSGVNVYDLTVVPPAFVGTVLSIATDTVTLTGNAAVASDGAADLLAFSAFGDPTGTAPSTITNTARVNLPTATGDGWGTAIGWGLYDASTSGELLTWDFLGGFSWLPFESTNVGSGDGPVFTAKANGFSNLDSVVATNEYGGILPSLSAGTLTGYTINYVKNAATDSFTLTQTSGGSPITSTTTGSGNIRKIKQQIIPDGVAPFFDPSTLVVTGA